MTKIQNHIIKEMDIDKSRIGEIKFNNFGTKMKIIKISNKTNNKSIL